MPNMPRFETVKVPPDSSGGVIFPSRTFSASSRDRAAMSPRDLVSASKIVGTTSADNQTELIMRIFQGDNEHVSKNEQLGEFTFSGIRPARAGDVQVEITFDVNVEGILTMYARDPSSGKELKTTVRVTSA